MVAMTAMEALAGVRFSVSDDAAPLFVVSHDGREIVRLDDQEAVELRRTWKSLVALWWWSGLVLCPLPGFAESWVELVLAFVVMMAWAQARSWAPRLLVCGKPIRRAESPGAHATRGKFSRQLGRSGVRSLMAGGVALGALLLGAWYLTWPWGAPDPLAARGAGTTLFLFGGVVSWLLVLLLHVDLSAAEAGNRHSAVPGGQGEPSGSGKPAPPEL